MRPVVAVLIAAAIATAAVAPGTPVRAGALSDYVLAPGAFAPEAAAEEAGGAAGSGVAEAPDWPLSYRHERHGPGEAPPVAETVSLAPVEQDGVQRLVLTRTADGGPARELSTFSPDAANPVVLFFLEATARSMAEATGGSPFYIRNRIREALGAADLGTAGEANHGGTVIEVQKASLVPFATDPNRARMGEFADLALTMTLAPGLPGRVLELSADTAGPGTGYHEHLTLIPEVK